MPVVAGRDRDPPIRPHVNAIGIEEARALHKAKFADRKVDAQAIRQALRYLGVCPPGGPEFGGHVRDVPNCISRPRCLV